VDLSASVGLRLTADEVPGAAERLAAELAASPTPELHLAVGLMSYAQADCVSAVRHLEAAYLAFRHQRRLRRASIAATHLGRVHHDGIGSAAVAGGWFARSLRLLDGDEDCPERGWAALGLVGCSVTNADQLASDAALALRLARRFDDVDLECKALADSGLAIIGHGSIDEGMRRIDEAMAMVTSGECANVFITGQIWCCLVSACERAGDLPRLADWIASGAAPVSFVLPNGKPNLNFTHCQSEYGSLLCEAGRWPEAEAALRQAVAASESLQYHAHAEARAALAGLRIDQGRLAEAAELLTGMELRFEAQLPLVRLHAARGDHDLAAAVARQAIRMFTGDRVRCAPFYAVLVDAELSRGHREAAAEAAARLETAAAATTKRPARALAALASARVAAANSEPDAAIGHLERGIGELTGDQWPLLAADLHLELAALLAGRDRVLAIAEARRALALSGVAGAHGTHRAQRMLHQLGDAAPAAPDPARVLTAREREILRLVAQGLSNPEIAAQLVISPKTAENHVSSILRKLSLRNRSEAAVYAATLAR
jgi:DNA-binding CsgD family transcriptional regulator